MQWLSSKLKLSTAQPGALEAPSTSADQKEQPANQAAAMFRQTAPGRMESLCKAPQMFGYQQSSVAQAAAGGPWGADSIDLDLLQDDLLQQLREHSLTDGQPISHASNLQYSNAALDELRQQPFPSLAPVSTGKASGTAGRSFTFQQAGLAGQQSDNLEALFSKAEATVDQYLDSPHAAMLFGDDTTDTLAQLCARLPSASTRPLSGLNPFSNLAGQYAAGQYAGQLAGQTGGNLTATLDPGRPSTPPSSRKRHQHPSADDNPVRCSETDLPSSAAAAAAAFGRSSFRLSSDTGTPGRRRWGLDLSDEGSGMMTSDWRISTSDDTPLAAAAAADDGAGSDEQLVIKQPRSSENCISHHPARPNSTSGAIYCGGNDSMAASPCLTGAAAAAAVPAAGTVVSPPPNSSSTCRKIRIKTTNPRAAGSVQGNLPGSSSSTRRSCPGGWISMRSKLAHVSSPAVIKESAPVVLDLSTPPPESPRDRVLGNDHSAAAAAATAAAARCSTQGAGALRRTTGDHTSDSGMRLSGHKHSKGSSIVTNHASNKSNIVAGRLDVPEPDLHRAAGRQSWGGVLTVQDPAAAAAAAAAAAPKRRLKLHFKGHSSSGGGGGAGGVQGDKLASSGMPQQQQRQHHPPAAANQYPSFTSWAQDTNAAAAAVVRTMAAAAAAAAVNGTVADPVATHNHPIRSPFQDCAAVSEAIFGRSGWCETHAAAAAAAAVTPSTTPKTRTGVKAGRKSSPGSRSATAAAGKVPSAFAAATVQLSPFAAAAAAAAPPCNAQQQQQQQQQQGETFYTPYGTHVGISITTQSGTGPMTRRVSSQLLIRSNTNADQMGAADLLYHNAGPNAQQQQQDVLHLQLPRIRTKSQPISEADAFQAALAAFGGTTSSSSGAGVISSGTPGTSSSTMAAAAALEAALETPGSSRQVSPGMLRQVGLLQDMTLQSGGSNSPSSNVTTSSAAAAASGLPLVPAAAPAAARSGSPGSRLAGGYHTYRPHQHHHQQQQQQQQHGKQQKQQRQSVSEVDEVGAMYAQYCRARPVTTSMPLAPQVTSATSRVPTAAAAGIATTEAGISPFQMQMVLEQQQQQQQQQQGGMEDIDMLLCAEDFSSSAGAAVLS